MTANEPVRARPEQVPPSFRVNADRLTRLLASLGVAAMVAAVAAFVLAGPRKTTGLAPFLPASLGGLTAGALLLSVFGVVAAVAVMSDRRRDASQSLNAMLGMRRLRETTVTLLFTAAAAFAVLSDWPLRPPATSTLAPSADFTVASALLLLAIPWLLADRYLAAVKTEWLPELRDLRALLFLPVFFLLAQAILQLAAALDFGACYWLRIGLAVILLLICAELALRVLGSWFLPPRKSGRAAMSSFVASLLHGRSLSPGNMAGIVRAQFGMDFSRSWALRFMRMAALPVGLLMLAFSWFLTGVTRIDMNERGSYESFGRPAIVLQPGLHLVLPLPFGVVRHAEFGVIHSALISYGDPGAHPDTADVSTAEGDAPALANRLWDSEQPGDVSYIIASGEQNRQSFQTVSVNVRVLYRLGLGDEGVRAALYRVADPEALVHSLSGRMLAQFFAARTLPTVLGEDKGLIAADMRTQLQQELDALGSDIDIVALIIETIHPPSGTAPAYRNVQAAEIAASTSIATEQGRAQTSKNVARLNAHNATNDASALAAETVSAAQIDLTNIAADDRPYRAASQPFLLERYFSDIRAALDNVPLEIVDHRLSGVSQPTIDLRPAGAPLAWSGDGSEGRSNQGGKTP